MRYTFHHRRSRHAPGDIRHGQMLLILKDELTFGSSADRHGRPRVASHEGYFLDEVSSSRSSARPTGRFCSTGSSMASSMARICSRAAPRRDHRGSAPRRISSRRSRWISTATASPYRTKCGMNAPHIPSMADADRSTHFPEALVPVVRVVPCDGKPFNWECLSRVSTHNYGCATGLRPAVCTPATTAPENVPAEIALPTLS
jgi:hypothetical protein